MKLQRNQFLCQTMKVYCLINLYNRMKLKLLLNPSSKRKIEHPGVKLLQKIRFNERNDDDKNVK